MGRRDSEAPASSVVFVVGRPIHGAGGGAAPAGGGASSFDTNVVIILGALFFALLFAVGLNSLVRYALRYRGGRSGADASSVGGGGGGGMKRRALRSLPVEVYGVGEDIDDVCAICLGEFVDGEKVRVLPRCGHGFHVRCVDAWLVSNGSCPTCRCLVMDGELAKGDVGRSLRPDDDSHSTTIVVLIA